MNPIFDPGTSGAPQFVPGTSPQLFSAQLASTGGGDPGTVGGGGGWRWKASWRHGNPGESAGPAISPTQQQLAAAPARPLGGQFGGSANASNHSRRRSLGSRDALREGVGRHPGLVIARNHQGAIGTDYSRYAMGGNIGNSAAGAQGRYQPVDSVGDYPWMQDQNIQWGGGPFGYLPINYQPQAADYYSTNQNQLAPWEYEVHCRTPGPRTSTRTSRDSSIRTGDLATPTTTRT